MASGQSHETSGLHATRQMIDELDALMERMLALPVNDQDEPEAPRTPVSSPAAAPLTAKLTLLQVPAEEAPQSAHVGTNPSHLPVLGVVRSANPPPSAPTLPPLPEAAPVPVTPLSDRVVPSAVHPDLDSLICEVPEPTGSLGSWFIVLLVWGNRLFDHSTAYLGEPGRWLRGTVGRLMLGLSGIALFAAACWWLLSDWFGW
jgi:hypothetical protein